MAKILREVKSTDKGLIGITQDGKEIPLSAPRIFSYETSVKSGGRKQAISALINNWGPEYYIQPGEVMLVQLSYINPHVRDIPGHLPFALYKQRE